MSLTISSNVIELQKNGQSGIRIHAYHNHGVKCAELSGHLKYGKQGTLQIGFQILYNIDNTWYTAEYQKDCQYYSQCLITHSNIPTSSSWRTTPTNVCQQLSIQFQWIHYLQITYCPTDDTQTTRKMLQLKSIKEEKTRSDEIMIFFFR